MVRSSGSRGPQTLENLERVRTGSSGPAWFSCVAREISIHFGSGSKYVISLRERDGVWRGWGASFGSVGMVATADGVGKSLA